MFRDQLSQSFVTLAESLRAAGYRTVGFTANPWIGPKMGFGQGFDLYQQIAQGAAYGVDQAIAALATDDGQQPLFLFLFLMDPHDPYEPPPGYRPRTSVLPNADDATILPVEEKLGKGLDQTPQLADLRDFYDGEVRFTDHELERLFRSLQDSGRYDDALIVLFSDHGEEFGEHRGTRHGNSLYQSLLHVPLQIKYPKGRDPALPREAMVQQIDLMPTLLSLAQCPPPEGMDGLDLTRASAHTLSERVALGYLETGQDADTIWEEPWARKYESATGAGYKLHLRRCDSFRPYSRVLEFYDLASDPGEQNDLSAQGAVEMGYLWAALRQGRAGGVVAEHGETQAAKDAFDTLPYLR
jgi:arylsulfatase A-like enzyme